MDNITQGSFVIEFPEDMTKEEIDWIKDQLFWFLEVHSCKVKKGDENESNQNE